MAKHPTRHSLGKGVLLLAAGLIVSSNAIAGPAEDAVAKARQAVAEGRCEQARRTLSAVDGLESRARLLAGQCHIQAGRYPEALDQLELARGRKDLSAEQLGDVELFRGIALYHLERYTEARGALDDAEGITREEAQLSLYRGLLALRDGDNQRAAPALESAAALSPGLTEPVASYYAGLAWQGADENTRARDAFRRVVALDGDGPWGREAQKLLDVTEPYPYYVRGKFGIEYDDNVVLRGQNVTEVQTGTGSALDEIGERDWRGVWEIDAGVQLFRKDDWSGGLTASYAGNAHFDISDLNTQYPTIGGYLANRIRPRTVAQARYSFGHAWVDEDPYLQTHLAELSLTHSWERAGTTVVVADVLANDLRFEPFDVTDGTTPGAACTPAFVGGCSPPGVDERNERERDGVGVGAAFEHRYLVPIADGVDEFFREVQVGGGYRIRYYDAEGDEWEHLSHVFSATLDVALPLEITARTRFSYEARDFFNPSTFPDNEVVNVTYFLSNADREEHEVMLQGEVEKAITDHLGVSARYVYTNNESNRSVYDYDRHVVGAYVNFRFD